MRLARDVDATLEDWRQHALALEREVAKVVLGQEQVIRLLTIATLARGHVLLEGDVGVGKTTILRALARALGGPFERLEGTVDLVPGDLIYYAHLGADGRPKVDPGPLLRHGPGLSVLFFNEINRARPQVHSLLLRVMAERSVHAFGAETVFPHLQVFADRNRVEREETFELPAAARDRFLMEIDVETPDLGEVRRGLMFDPRFHDVDRLVGEVREGVLDHRELGAAAAGIQRMVRASPAIEGYALALWQAVRHPDRAGIKLDGVDTTRLVQGGASPRGMSYLIRAARVRAWLEGREILVPEDLRAVFTQVMAHRIFLEPAYELRREPIVAALSAAIFKTVPAP